MSPGELTTLHVIHVFSALLLFGTTFYAFAAEQKSRMAVLSWNGVAALGSVLTGLRLWQGLYGFHVWGWILVKLVCWLGLAALCGIGFRRREQAKLLMTIASVLALIAVAMVFARPF